MTGTRPGEILRLKPEGIDRTGDIWTWRPSEHKTAHKGKTRFIAFGPKAQAILEAMPPRMPGVLCFHNRSRSAWNTNTYRWAITRACDKAGIGHWSPNQLRHAAATEIASKYGLREAAKVLGHSDEAVTKFHLDQDEQAVCAAAARLG